MSDYFFIKAGNKEFHHFIRTEGRIYDITNCSILTDGHIDENNGLIPDAIPVSEEYVAELVARSNTKRKASLIRKLAGKEEVKGEIS